MDHETLDGEGGIWVDTPLPNFTYILESVVYVRSEEPREGLYCTGEFRGHSLHQDHQEYAMKFSSGRIKLGLLIAMGGGASHQSPGSSIGPLELGGCNYHNGLITSQRQPRALDHRELWTWSGEHDQRDKKPKIRLNTIRRRKEERRRRPKAITSIEGHDHLFSE